MTANNDTNAMHPAIDPRLESALIGARDRYHRLVLVVGAPRSGKTHMLLAASAAKAWPRVNINLSLSEALLDFTPKQRAIRAAELLGRFVEKLASEVVLLDNIEILFAPELALDPLRLLQGLARTRTIIAAWTGSFGEDVLTYAEPGHREFRKYVRPEALVVYAASSIPQESA